MKISMYRHSIKEMIRNMVRHPLVTLASVTTMGLMLFLVGSFIALSLNARHMIELAGQKPPIEITMKVDASPEEVELLARVLSKDEKVLDFEQYTPEENLNNFKDAMGKEELFEDFSSEYIPYTFLVRLKNPGEGEEFQKTISGLPGIRQISLEQSVMEFLNKAIRWVHMVTILAFAVLGVIALFIISNMVRIAVLARADEIGIMKAVGATNWYIRVPFILEGAAVGLLGSLAASGIIWLLYSRLYHNLMPGVESDSVLSMLSTAELMSLIFIFTLLIGVLVGSLGSAFSVRRHVKV